MKHEPVFICEPHGPVYNIAGATLDKHRRAARKGGLQSMSKAERNAYGEAVEKAVLAAQRSALQRELPSHNVNCPSGCSAPDGETIHRHMQAKQRAALLAAPSQERRARTPDQWRKMYAEAMEEKAKAEEARKLAETDKRIARQKRTMNLKPKAKTTRSRAA